MTAGLLVALVDTLVGVGNPLATVLLALATASSVIGGGGGVDVTSIVTTTVCTCIMVTV